MQLSCKLIVAGALCLVLFAADAAGQTRDTPRVEAGVFAGALDLRESLHEKPLTWGLRAGYRVAPWLSLESALTVAPESNAGNFGEMVLVAGPKAGLRFGRVGVHGKLHAGVMRVYGRGFTVFNSGARTEPALDAGAAIEIELSSRTDLRIDTGRLIVPFGSEPILGGVPPYSRTAGTVRHPVTTVGVQIRF